MLFPFALSMLSRLSVCLLLLLSCSALLHAAPPTGTLTANRPPVDEGSEQVIRGVERVGVAFSVEGLDAGVPPEEGEDEATVTYAWRAERLTEPAGSISDNEETFPVSLVLTDADREAEQPSRYRITVTLTNSDDEETTLPGEGEDEWIVEVLEAAPTAVGPAAAGTITLTTTPVTYPLIDLGDGEEALPLDPISGLFLWECTLTNNGPEPLEGPIGLNIFLNDPDGEVTASRVGVRYAVAGSQVVVEGALRSSSLVMVLDAGETLANGATVTGIVIGFSNPQFFPVTVAPESIIDFRVESPSPGLEPEPWTVADLEEDDAFDENGIPLEGTGWQVARSFNTIDGQDVLQFNVPAGTVQIQYDDEPGFNDDPGSPLRVARGSGVFTGGRAFWVDRGWPKTEPSAGARFYRVLTRAARPEPEEEAEEE